MRYGLLIVLLLIALPVWAQNNPSPQAAVQEKAVLVNDITIEGFVLGDKERFMKIFKPYRHKHLTRADMDAMLSQVQIIYESEGYQQLVSIGYKVIKHRLVFSVSMTS